MPKIKDLVGHTSQLMELERDIAYGNIAHAYLFSGPRHLGKMTVANRFAFEILAHGLDNGERKDVQRNIERLTHPDFLVLDQLWMEETMEDWDTIAKSSNVSQTHRSKAKVKTDTISIDDIRALQERLIETGVGAMRCCVIRSMERMRDEAANAFLKILEEPPPGLVFILTTQKKSTLLPTIVSRTRTINFRPLSTKDLRPLLEDCSDDDRQFILHLAQGAPGIVKLLCSDPDALREHKLIHGNANSFWNAYSLTERLRLLEPLYERDEESDEFLLHLALALREQSPSIKPQNIKALSSLVAGSKTNVHRQLLAQEFALAVS
jgi:hypothetical protein